jgi:hypothetical protein
MITSLVKGPLLGGPPLPFKAHVNAGCDRCRNPESDVTALVEFLRAIDPEHTDLVVEEGTDYVGGESPELRKLFRFKVALKCFVASVNRLRDGNRKQLSQGEYQATPVGAIQMAVEFRPAWLPTFKQPGRQGLYSHAG